MFVAFAIFDIFSVQKIFFNIVIIICLPLLVAGAFFSLKVVRVLASPLHYEERDVGRVLKQKETGSVPVYVLDWPFLETISYYGSKKLLTLGFEKSGTTLKAPFYLVTNNLVMSYFYNREGYFMSGYENVSLLYGGQYLVLIYADKDLVLPVFSHR